MKDLTSVAAGMLCLTVAGAAGAISIDFREGAFAPASGANHHSVVYEGYSFSFDALNVAGMGHDGSLSWDSSDGFGIIGAGWENDEIELPEVLSLSFGEAIYVEHVLVTDLFIEHGGTRREHGFYSLDGGNEWTAFLADGADSNGEMRVAVDAMASELLFTSAGRDARTRHNGHEFALAGIEVYRHTGGGHGPAVPEPTAAVLFAAGALAIGRRNRRA